MAQDGFIFLHRKISDWEWYSDANTMRLFIHCLIKANYKDKQWHGILIKKGSFITSYEKLSIELGLTIRQIRTAIDKLKTTSEITYQSTNQYSIISINNWNKFQEDNRQNDNQMTIKRQTNDKQMTTTNKENKENKENKDNKLFIVPKVEEIENYCSELNYNIDAEAFFDFYQSKGWMVGKNKMKDWKAAVRNWARQGNSKIKKVSDKSKLIQLLRSG